jgi:hypothetical protein
MGSARASRAGDIAIMAEPSVRHEVGPNSEREGLQLSTLAVALFGQACRFVHVPHRLGEVIVVPAALSGSLRRASLNSIPSSGGRGILQRVPLVRCAS